MWACGCATTSTSKEFLEDSLCKDRFIFMPQCVRSTECPAKLTPEGIKCVNCGRCSVGEAKKYAEGLGYRFFIVPGSSFIKRIIKKYRPQSHSGRRLPDGDKRGPGSLPPPRHTGARECRSQKRVAWLRHWTGSKFYDRTHRPYKTQLK